MDPNNVTNNSTQPNVDANPPQDNAGNTNGEKKSFLNKKVITIIVAVLSAILILALVIGYLVTSLDTDEQAGPEIEDTQLGNANIVLATVGNRDLYRSDVEAVALEQYSQDAVTNEVIETFLPLTVERVILDIEAERIGTQLDTTDTAAYYDQLRDIVVQGELESVEAYDINWWIPPAPEYEQLPEFEQQRAVTPNAVAAIEQGLNAGQTPVDVVSGVVENYPSLSGIIGINGGQFEATEDKSVFDEPRVHNYDEAEQDKLFFQELFQMEEGQIDGFVWEDGSGAAVIQVTSVQEGEQIDYDQWLEQKEAELVTYYQDNIDLLYE